MKKYLTVISVCFVLFSLISCESMDNILTGISAGLSGYSSGYSSYSSSDSYSSSYSSGSSNSSSDYSDSNDYTASDSTWEDAWGHTLYEITYDASVFVTCEYLDFDYNVQTFSYTYYTTVTGIGYTEHDCRIQASEFAWAEANSSLSSKFQERNDYNSTKDFKIGTPSLTKRY